MGVKTTINNSPKCLFYFNSFNQYSINLIPMILSYMQNSKFTPNKLYFRSSPEICINMCHHLFYLYYNLLKLLSILTTVAFLYHRLRMELYSVLCCLSV